MPDGVISNLGLTAGAGLYANTGIVANTALTTSISSYESTPLMANLLAAIGNASGISANTKVAMAQIGANVDGNYFPALGDAVPSNVALSAGNVVVLDPESGSPIGNVPAPSVMTQLLTANTATYLGNGNFRVFAQGFQTALGWISVTNQVINSLANASDYLGPTFTTMDDLITGDLAQVNLAFPAFAQDLTAAGVLIDLGNLDALGTPAALLQQISKQGNMINGTLPAVRDALLSAGLTDQDISDLVNDNRQGLLNPNGLTDNQFDRLQKLAYPALCTITGADLEDALTILAVTTPNINALCELLDPIKIFPNSFASLTLPTPSGPILIYDQDGSVNSDVEPVLNSGSVTPKGCNDLAKIVPPDQAAANRALQVALQQVKGIETLTLPQLAESLR